MIVIQRDNFSFIDTKRHFGYGVYEIFNGYPYMIITKTKSLICIMVLNLFIFSIANAKNIGLDKSGILDHLMDTQFTVETLSSLITDDHDLILPYRFLNIENFNSDACSGDSGRPTFTCFLSVSFMNPEATNSINLRQIITGKLVIQGTADSILERVDKLRLKLLFSAAQYFSITPRNAYRSIQQFYAENGVARISTQGSFILLGFMAIRAGSTAINTVFFENILQHMIKNYDAFGVVNDAIIDSTLQVNPLLNSVEKKILNALRYGQPGFAHMKYNDIENLQEATIRIMDTGNGHSRRLSALNRYGVESSEILEAFPGQSIQDATKKLFTHANELLTESLKRLMTASSEGSKILATFQCLVRNGFIQFWNGNAERFLLLRELFTYPRNMQYLASRVPGLWSFGNRQTYATTVMESPELASKMVAGRAAKRFGLGLSVLGWSWLGYDLYSWWEDSNKSEEDQRRTERFQSIIQPHGQSSRRYWEGHALDMMRADPEIEAQVVATAYLLDLYRHMPLTNE